MMLNLSRLSFQITDYNHLRIKIRFFSERIGLSWNFLRIGMRCKLSFSAKMQLWFDKINQNTFSGILETILYKDINNYLKYMHWNLILKSSKYFYCYYYLMSSHNTRNIKFIFFLLFSTHCPVGTSLK